MEQIDMKDIVHRTLDDWKSGWAGKERQIVLISDAGHRYGKMVVIGEGFEKANPWAVDTLAEWRMENMDAFPTQFKVTKEGTKKWISSQVVGNKERILFIIEDNSGSAIGHIGLATFDFVAGSCEIDNVVRGRRGVEKGIMSAAMQSLIGWVRENIGIRVKINLRVFSDNLHAVRFYERNGFTGIRKIPLKRVEEEGTIKYIEAGEGDPADRHFLLMTLKDLEEDKERQS